MRKVRNETTETSRESSVSPEEFYSWEHPNPALSLFSRMGLNQAASPDGYEVHPINRMVPGIKNDPLYMLHTYWAKKPFNAIRVFIEHFTSEGNLILDPFVGCGSTAIVAALAGRRVIAGDVAPSAMKIACGYCNDHPFPELRKIRNVVCNRIWERIAWLYELVDKYVRSIVVAESFRCVKCFRVVSVGELGIEEQHESCPHCGDPLKTRTMTYIKGSAAPYLIQLQDRPLSNRGGLSFIVGHSLKYDRSVSALYREIEKANEEGLPPDRPIPQRLIDLGGRLQSTGTVRVSQLFSKRQRLILSAMKQVIGEFDCSSGARRSLEFLFSAILLNSTQMYRARKKGGVAGAYYLPPVRREIDSFRAFAEKYDDLLRVEESYPASGITGKVLLTCQSAGDLAGIPANSIDYIFTDPPYADTMPFGSLNAIYDYWWNTETDYVEVEAIGENWARVMAAFFREAYRVMKPGRWVSVCYHDTSEGTWALMQDLAAQAGLVADGARHAVGIDARQKAYQQTVADKVTKRDLVINFRKPAEADIVSGLVIVGDENESTFREKVAAVIREYLEVKPGSTRDRIYDDVVSRMVRSGSMERHNFDEVLNLIAEETGDTGGAGRWYLKETGEVAIDAAESAKEDAAAVIISSFIGKKLKGSHEEGVHYSDIFELYIYVVKDKPRLALIDLLADYFYKTEEGTWRLPLSKEEEELKARARAAGTNRRIKRFASMLSSGVTIPMEKIPSTTTLAEWIRHAKRTGLFEVGKLLYERGGLDASKLSEEMAVGVEEDYQVCVRMLARGTGSPAVKAKRSRG